VELLALQQSPGDRGRAVALAEVLLARAHADSEFGQALKNWWAQAEPVREKLADVTITISGGNQYGPVLQGRDFTGLTFGATPASPAARSPPRPPLNSGSWTGGCKRYRLSVSA